jgi:mannose-6-phosphate isomerase
MVQRVNGVVQHYDWGDTTFIPELLGVEPDGRPWAELWLGTHPNGPSTLDDGRPLSDETGELPYLLKVISAARPLSVQTHPDRTRAEIGFREGRYPDPNPKPELLCALTPFEALCGVRPVHATLELLGELGVVELADVVRERGPGAAIDDLYRGRLDAAPVVAAAATSRRPEAGWVTRLGQMYPGQPSVAVTILLNHVVLAPGEAIHLGAGNLHAYLVGSGLELMGASDNVVRGGLTSKHVDVEELLDVLDPTPLDDPVMPHTERYPLDETDVALVRLEAGVEHVSTGHELAIDLTGRARYLAPGDQLAASSTTYVVTTAFTR